jgi:hypothetical protein
MEPQKENRLKSWLKRIGILGFLFFLGKGILWILVAAGAFRYCARR